MKLRFTGLPTFTSLPTAPTRSSASETPERLQSLVRGSCHQYVTVVDSDIVSAVVTAVSR